MNEFEENVYIKNELVQSVIDKKINNYFTNRNELTHYYNVGKMIVEAQGGESRAKYGDSLIKKISNKLTNDLGKGFDFTTIKRMRQFYLIMKKGAPLAHQLSWSHYMELLPIKDINEISYYINISINQKLSRNKLREKIKNKEYQRVPIKTRSKLINKEENKIDDFIKNPIIINTYGNNTKNISERILKEYILHDIDNFLKELGNGFCYIENEYKIKIGNSYNYIDILLFNYIYNAFIVVELKVNKFDKNNLGQIQVYMNYIDRHIKGISQDKTIGIIVCRKDNKYLIEYSSDDRIRVTTYELI